MAEKHPNELELLSFVEEDLGAGARRDVAEHLVACGTCTEQVRRLEAGREAIRSAPSLELTDERRDEILAALPERPDPWRRFRPVKRGFVVAVPVAAAALAVVFVVSGTPQLGGGDDSDSASPAAAEESARDEGGLETTTGAASEAAPMVTAPEGTTFVQFAQGPPAELVRLLAGDGIQAEVEPGGGVIADARASEVRAALASRATGDVPVYVR
jgi:anti-sigma factor RsiW